MWENKDQINSEYGHVSLSEIAAYYSIILQKVLFGLKVLQILQGHFLGLHLRFLFLKFFNGLALFKFRESRFHMILIEVLIEHEPF